MMGSAYYIAVERQVDGLETHVDGKSLAKCKYLDGLANQAKVRPLLEFFSMNPEEAESIFDEVDEEEAAPEFPPEVWFEAADGLDTIRGLIKVLEQGPGDLPDDPVPNFFPNLPPFKPTPPPQEAILEDLMAFEAVLTQLDATKIRWHLAVDF
jgi:hypothetical protein